MTSRGRRQAGPGRLQDVIEPRALQVDGGRVCFALDCECSRRARGLLKSQEPASAVPGGGLQTSVGLGAIPNSHPRLGPSAAAQAKKFATAKMLQHDAHERDSCSPTRCGSTAGSLQILCCSHAASWRQPLRLAEGGGLKFGAKSPPHQCLSRRCSDYKKKSCHGGEKSNFENRKANCNSQHPRPCVAANGRAQARAPHPPSWLLVRFSLCWIEAIPSDLVLPCANAQHSLRPFTQSKSARTKTLQLLEPFPSTPN
jgi:hypothetical protein